MRFNTDRDEKCVSSWALIDEEGNDIPSQCEWQTESAYMEVCLTCGAVAVYN